MLLLEPTVMLDVVREVVRIDKPPGLGFLFKAERVEQKS